MNYNETKISTELEIALDTPEAERERSLDLNVGYDKIFNEWELIVKYTGDIGVIAEKIGFEYTELFSDYAIIRIRQGKVDLLSMQPEIIFIEKPKSLYSADTTIRAGMIASCMDITSEQLQGTSGSRLTGEGVFVAVIDSGIDYTHPYFFRPDGSSKIFTYWNQNVPGNPPEGYNIGSIYSAEDLSTFSSAGLSDITGHGTAVAGIIATVVPDSQLIVVKLADSDNYGFPRTTSLMMAIDFSIRISRQYNLPIVINLSFGNNYGDHAGNSVLENYIDDVSRLGKISFVTGMGNDGNSGRHIRKNLLSNSLDTVNFQVRPYETAINLQIWRSYSDDMDISLITPRNITLGPFNKYQEIMTFNLSDMTVIVLNGSPTPINQNQETYISIIPRNTYIEEGIWSIVLKSREVTDGRVDLWLPVADSTSTSVEFLLSDADTTMTIPASADNIISVGAYDVSSLTYATFSGRGFTRDERVKPEISAPGVNIRTAAAGGGEITVSGTSFAAPFVSAGAAMLMQWGITEGNDPYLYAEKLKAYLIRGAKRLPGYIVWPNQQIGYGVLCVRDSIPV